MKLIIVDDELLLIENLKESIDKLPFVESLHSFTSPKAALEYVASNPVDTAILDIEMPGMTGLALADSIHSLNSDINIIFLTSYSQYALEAFGVDAVDYILKPFSDDDLKKALQKTIPYINSHLSSKVSIHTFDGFDIYVNDIPLHFPRKKSKELLALLVDKRGASVSSAEAIAYLWENAIDDSKLRENYKKCAYTLRKILKDAGIADIINDSYNSLSLNIHSVKCDYYDYLEKDAKALNMYHGSYMPGYSWAEETNGLLYNLSQK